MGARQNRLTKSVLTCTHNLCFEQNMKLGKTNKLKIVIFTVVKNRCMMHGRVYVITHYANMHMQYAAIYRSCKIDNF